ncbi:MAG: hypothetical protein ACRERE_13360 [Candidatus Entotheonellia bacterium]
MDRAVFTVDSTKSILGSVDFQKLAIEQFDRMALRPEKLWVAELRQPQPEDGQSGEQYPVSAWKSLTNTSAVEIRGRGDAGLPPRVILKSLGSEVKPLGTLDGLLVEAGSEVVLEVWPTISVTWSDRPVELWLHEPHEPFQLVTAYCQISGIAESLAQTNSQTFKAQLPEWNPFIDLMGQYGSLWLSLTISAAQTTSLFSGGDIPIPVRAMNFTRLNDSGVKTTTLVKGKEYKLTYSEYPQIQEVSFTHPVLIELDRLHKFSIREIVLDPEHKGIHLRLHGYAGHIRTKLGAIAVDHRLTRLDALWHGPLRNKLYPAMAWIIGTIIAGYRVYREYIARRS